MTREVKRHDQTSADPVNPHRGQLNPGQPSQWQVNDGRLRPPPLLTIAAYTALVFALGGLAAWPSHQLLGLLMREPPLLHEWTADLLKLVALLGIWPLLRWSRLSWRDGLGLGIAGQWPRGLQSLLIGVAGLALLSAILLALDVRVVKDTITTELVWRAAFKASITALLVATIEELWFRGALHAVLQRIGGWTAVGIVAVIYTTLHFLRPDVALVAPYEWLDGYTAIFGMFGRMGDAGYWDSALALLCAGLMFGWLRQTTGHILLAWGLHVGWVFGIQMTRRLTDLNRASDYSFAVGKYDGIVGIGFICVVALTLVAFRWLSLHHNRHQNR
jgi:uncharacterized protein